MRRGAWNRVGWVAALITVVLAGAVQAQQLGLPRTAILTVSSERLYAQSAFGERVAREIDEDSRALAAENRQIEAAFIEEERQLTERRADMSADDFRALADAFDAKVRQMRERQDAKARALIQRNDEARKSFLSQVGPVLVNLMRETGAGVILERSSVFVSANSIDITDVAISRIDAAIGDGTEQGSNP